MPDVPTLHFLYSAVDELALDCKHLERMRLAPKEAHRQTYYSVYWVASGSATFSIDFVEYPVGPATLTLLQPGQVFFPHVSAPLHGLALYFPRDFLAVEALGTANPFPLLAGADARAFAPLAVDQEQFAHLHDLISLIADEFACRRPGREAMIHAALHMLLVRAGRLRPVTTGALYPPLAQAFFGLVERHFREMPRTSQYAHLLGVTPGHLNEVVKGAIGQTASRVLHERTLLEAKRLLFETDTSIADIATRLAFTDASYFTRFFHRATGLPPTAFRRSIHEKSRNNLEKSLEVS